MGALTNQATNAAKAVKHTALMEKKYKDQINYSIDNTIIFEDNTFESFNLEAIKETETKPEVRFKNTDTVSAIFNGSQMHVPTILNFASFKSPGGFFLKGSSAQEECLCHESCLYNVLSEFNKYYYKPNKKLLNNGLYTNRALYSPNVVFVRENEHGNTETKYANVITCAAPNFSTASKYYGVSYVDNLFALRNRIKFIKNIAQVEGTYELILGAFGAGVFGQNPYDVANTFASIFRTSTVEVITYAVPGKDKNADIFRGFFDQR